jgi:PEP-CTERM motif
MSSENLRKFIGTSKLEHAGPSRLCHASAAQVQVSGGEFFWLSGDRPLTGADVGPTPDLQVWIRDGALQPDWSRVGTDIVGGATPPTFNGAFSLDATAAPEPGTFGLSLAALGLAGWVIRRRRSE